jgi:hypothetical protein
MVGRLPMQSGQDSLLGCHAFPFFSVSASVGKDNRLPSHALVGPLSPVITRLQSTGTSPKTDSVVDTPAKAARIRWRPFAA